MTAFKQLKIGLLLVFALLTIGAFGFHFIEGWSLLDSLYMTVITVATVGFREVRPLSIEGKIFTISIILVGVTLTFWVLTSLIELTVSEQIWHALARRKMEDRISKMSDHYIICGFGRMGQQIAKDFANHKVPFVVIETNPEQIPKLLAKKIPFIEGNAADDAVLVSAGVKRAKGLVTVSPSDADNIFITLSARVLNPNLFIVARSILVENEDKLIRAGADRVMSPYVMGGRRMSEAVLHPHVLDFLEATMGTDDMELQMQGIAVGESSKLAGKTLKESEIRKFTGATVLALKRPDGHLAGNPQPDTIINAGDLIIALGNPHQLGVLKRIAEG